MYEFQKGNEKNIVSFNPIPGVESDAREVIVCGGYLIAESIPNEEIKNLLVAAPDMLYALQVAAGDIEQDLKPRIVKKIIRDAINKANGVITVPQEQENDGLFATKKKGE